jgi:hypothetical protein
MMIVAKLNPDFTNKITVVTRPFFLFFFSLLFFSFFFIGVNRRVLREREVEEYT